MFDILRWGLPLFEFIFRFCILCEFVLLVYCSLIQLLVLLLTMDKKIVFFGEKTVFGGDGKDFQVEKSEVKKSEKNCRFFR